MSETNIEKIKITNREEADIFVRQLLNIGEAMYFSGGEISRIEDSLHRLGKVYGATHVNVYALTSNIVVTVEFEGDFSISQNRRITTGEKVDCSKMEKLNQLCRECVANPVSVYELREKVLFIIETNPSEYVIYAGEILSVMAFTVFFGGNGIDALVSLAGAILICIMQKWVKPLCSGLLFFNIIASFATGLLVNAINLLIPGLHINQIIIGDIMVLIPGIAITNSIRYILSGDKISSFEKLMDSLLQAFGIASGFMLAILCIRGNNVEPVLREGVGGTIIQLVAAMMGTFSFCLIFNIRKQLIIIPTIGGFLCWGVYLLASSFGINTFASVLLASVSAGVYGVFFAHTVKVPTTILFIPACVPLIPGSYLYYSTLAMLSRNWIAFRDNIATLALFAVGISIGLAVVTEFERLFTKIANLRIQSKTNK